MTISVYGQEQHKYPKSATSFSKPITQGSSGGSAEPHDEAYLMTNYNNTVEPLLTTIADVRTPPHKGRMVKYPLYYKFTPER